MLSIDDAVNLFVVMFELCFWLSMMIITVWTVKIAAIVYSQIPKGWGPMKRRGRP